MLSEGHLSLYKTWNEREEEGVQFVQEGVGSSDDVTQSSSAAVWRSNPCAIGSWLQRLPPSRRVTSRARNAVEHGCRFVVLQEKTVKNLSCVTWQGKLLRRDATFFEVSRNALVKLGSDLRAEVTKYAVRSSVQRRPLRVVVVGSVKVVT